MSDDPPGRDPREDARAHGTLVIRREPAPYRDRLRSYVVRVDGHAVGRIGWDATELFEVPAGRHTVTVHIDWGRSQPVEVEVTPGGLVAMRCRASGSGWQLWLLFAHNHYVVLEMDQDH